ncbi:hypothetical protein CFP65_4274 [Kitasatospora sp. MMS16-BH015]|uniref:hypothetical protein n=1 Tax=Kitasatospora sp. MMS16-BH015 TaxID=2018025 RepID=UPI000CA36BAB|nr:hypothetical protein [Kitasatospora sp. MMS16-BH015]AUG79028.1 hypothetical protein CFP65_4274 [Kitasatospora sp. MMS16-BH015]
MVFERSRAGYAGQESARDGELAPAAQAGLAVLLGAGLAGLVLFAVSTGDWARALGGSLMVAGGCTVTGGLLGFLFGIPKVLTSGAAAHPEDMQATSTSTYAPNTNLEQVSDWLTKILLGAGLTQLVTLPHRLHQLGDAVAPLVGGGETGRGAAQYGAALAVYFTVVGFVAAWLLTRLRMARALSAADRETLADSVNQTAIAAGSVKGIGPQEVRAMLCSGVQGLRIQALALLKGRPDPAAVPLVLDVLKNPLSSFELLQALQAARAALDADLTAGQRAEILAAVTAKAANSRAIPPRSRRRAVVEDILGHVQLPQQATAANAPDNSPSAGVTPAPPTEV